MKIDEIISTIFAIGCVAVLLAIWCGIVSWAINDANKRGKTIFFLYLLFWLLGPLSVIVWLFIRPPVLAKRQPESYQDADEALAAASRMDMLGDWDAAIALYDYVAQRWPEHQRYVLACLQKIKEKQALS